MRKIPTVLRRDPDDMRHVLPEVTPGCEWVLAGEGVPTRKYDGTCVRLDNDGHWWARREVKPGKTPPPGFDPVETDDTTGKTVGWEPVEQASHHKAFTEAVGTGGYARSFTPGTYELCGPKVNGNPEGYEEHRLILHAAAERYPVDGLGAFSVEWAQALVLTMGEAGWEGIVWHHPDGRMAKLKARDVT